MLSVEYKQLTVQSSYIPERRPWKYFVYLVVLATEIVNECCGFLYAANTVAANRKALLGHHLHQATTAGAILFYLA